MASLLTILEAVGRFQQSSYRPPLGPWMLLVRPVHPPYDRGHSD